MNAPKFDALLAQLPMVGFGVPSRVDRATWQAEGALVVAGTARGRDQFLAADPSLVGYTTSGDSTTIHLRAGQTGSGPALLAFTPVPFSFGADPEGRRQRAPKANRKTVAAPGGGASAMLLPCDETGTCCPDDAIVCDEPPPPPPPPPPASAPTVDFSASECSWVQYMRFPTPGLNNPGTFEADRDRDGLKDSCEHLLAGVFEPYLIFRDGEQHKGREPRYIVDYTPDGSARRVTIGYLLSYYWDGEEVMHAGDSEFIFVRLVPNGIGWSIHNITTSAHYGASLGWWFDETRTYGWSDYSYDGSHPLIWVSRSHHANYNTSYRCNQRSFDVCQEESYPRVSAGLGYYGQNSSWQPERNVGSVHHQFATDMYQRFGTDPAGVRTSCTRADNPWLQGTECYVRNPIQTPGGWTDAGATGQSRDLVKFAGWYSHEEGTSNYPTKLWDFGFPFSAPY